MFPAATLVASPRSRPLPGETEVDCAHRLCSCPDATIRQGDQVFCSEACALAGEAGIGDEICTCGHDGCGVS